VALPRLEHQGWSIKAGASRLEHQGWSIKAGMKAGVVRELHL
jgi:hypothetical protein